METDTFSFVTSSPNMVYVSAWLKDSDEEEDLYYQYTFAEVSFEVNVIDVCQTVPLIEKTAKI